MGTSYSSDTTQLLLIVPVMSFAAEGPGSEACTALSCVSLLSPVWNGSSGFHDLDTVKERT